MGIRAAIGIICPLLSFFAEGLAAGEDAAGADRLASDKKALAPIQGFVGAWKGSGLPKDGSGKAWGEESDWAWAFKDGRAALVFTVTGGRYHSAGRITPGEKAGTYVLAATQSDGKTEERYSGAVSAKGDLQLDIEKPVDGRPARVEIGMVAKGKRLVVTYYSKTPGGKDYSPMAEVGATRKGSDFGKDVTARECVVTGGLGTIAVQYKGQTYYVCCGGCKQEFQDEPEKVLAEYRARKEQEKSAKKD